MQETKTDYETIFNMFKGCDYNREYLMQPFKQNDNYIATDTNSMIILPIDKAELPFESQTKPACDSIINI